MNPIREYLVNAFSAHRLKLGYYALTSCVGLAGVVVGLVLMAFYAELFFELLGVSKDGSIPYISSTNKWSILLFFAGIPTCIYLGYALVAAFFGVVLVGIGKFSASEAINYALLSRYPARWFKDGT